MQLDEATRDFTRTSFTLVDLAGAERPDKVKDDAAAAAKAATEQAAKAKAASGKGKELANLTPEMLPSLLEGRDSGAMSQKQIDALLPLNFQTRVINFELFQLGAEVLKASEAHRKRKPYQAPKVRGPPTNEPALLAAVDAYACA